MPEQLSRLGQNWGWFLAAGISFIVFGIAALTWPVTSTLGLTFALGALFTVSGVVNIIQSIRLRKETGNGWHVLQAVTALAAGLLILRYPASGMLGIAIAMTFYFFVSAAAKGVIAFGMRPLAGWGWALASAIASFILGAYMIATFPISALWVPGLLLGIDFIFHGSSLIGFSSDLKNVHRKLRQIGEGPSEERKSA
ncbi:MAG: HdeD family acid-resistance protein [Oligoflexia bacterium]|nr:HdeD family acid-resistance protein [Oligoflexia bacterium]